MSYGEVKEKRTVEKDIVTSKKWTCEICGEVTCDKDNWDNKEPTGHGGYNEINEVTIEFRTGCNYPGGGNATIHIVDMCPKCFMSEFMDWVKGQGGKPRMLETDY